MRYRLTLTHWPYFYRRVWETDAAGYARLLATDPWIICDVEEIR